MMGDYDEHHVHDNTEMLSIYRIRPRRNNVERRQKAATNWAKTEDEVCNSWSGKVSSHEACVCTQEEKHKRLRRFISLERLQIRDMAYCGSCGLDRIIQEGYFPATPKAPETFFSIHLLRTLTEQSNAGSISRTAWAEGLRRSLSYKHGVEVQSFTRILRDTHHHYMAATTKFESRMDEDLTRYSDGQIAFKRESMRNTCPPCFNFSERDTDRAVHISVDGNMAHKRFVKGRVTEFEKPPLRALINYGVRTYHLANGSLDDKPEKQESSCGNSFKASKELKLSNKTKAILDETGLMGMCCIHGTFLRALNFYRSGERQTHVAALLRSVFEDQDIGHQISKVRLCYDIACQFDNALKRVLRDDQSSRVESRINRFHIYGHQYSCHVLYNLLRTNGWGLMNGEEIERLWAALRHLVRAGRVCTGPRKAQRVDAGIMHLARNTRENMGTNLARRINNALETAKNHNGVLEALKKSKLKIVGSDGVETFREVTDDYLAEQERLEHAYYKTGDGSGFRTIKDLVATQSGADADKESMSLWAEQRRIVHLLMNSAVELSEVQRCTRSLRNAADFMRALHSRGKTLEKAVNRYNLLLEKTPPKIRLGARKLEIKTLRDEGLNNDELYDLYRGASREDWAVCPQVRIGIKSLNRIKRAAEELDRCALHLSRHCSWVIDTADAIISYLQDCGPHHPRRHQEIKSMLMHRQSIAINLLKSRKLHEFKDWGRLDLVVANNKISKCLPTDSLFNDNLDKLGFDNALGYVLDVNNLAQSRARTSSFKDKLDEEVDDDDDDEEEEEELEADLELEIEEDLMESLANLEESEDEEDPDS